MDGFRWSSTQASAAAGVALVSGEFVSYLEKSRVHNLLPVLACYTIRMIWNTSQ